MNSLELINKLYKPYRITKVAHCTIVESADGKFVVKPKGKRNLKELYQYLKSRNFENFPSIIDATRSEINIFEYLEDTEYPKDQKAQDMIKLVAKLHANTTYTKEVREDKFKSIYEDIKNNLLYYKNSYNELVTSIEEEVFMSPSHYLFIRNSSKLLSQIAFCEAKLDAWYDSVKEKRESRVSLIHNNLSLKHYIYGDKEALISWDKSTTDSPILDIYNFYINEGLDLEFASVLSTYIKNFPLESDELNLLLIMICLPKEISFSDNEFIACEKIERNLDYVYKTEELVKQYFKDNNTGK